MDEQVACAHDEAVEMCETRGQYDRGEAVPPLRCMALRRIGQAEPVLRGVLRCMARPVVGNRKTYEVKYG